MRKVRGVDDKHHLTLLCRDLSELANYAKVDNAQFRMLKQATTKTRHTSMHVWTCIALHNQTPEKRKGAAQPMLTVVDDAANMRNTFCRGAWWTPYRPLMWG